MNVRKLKRWREDAAEELSRIIDEISAKELKRDALLEAINAVDSAIEELEGVSEKEGEHE